MRLDLCKQKNITATVFELKTYHGSHEQEICMKLQEMHSFELV